MQALLFAHLGKLTLSSSLTGGAFSWPKIVGGEDLTLKLRFAIDQDGTTVQTPRTVHAIKCSLGRQQIAPEDGTFTLKLGADPESAGSNTTAKLAYNISAADLAATLDALTDSALAACKPFAVTARDGSWFIAARDRSAIQFACVDNELWPSSKVHIASRDFDEGLGYELRLNQAPVAQVTTFNDIVPELPSISEIRAGATNSGVLTTELQKLYVPPELPAGFSFCLTRGYRKTAPIVIGSNDNAASLEALLNAKANTSANESGFIDDGDLFKAYSAPNGAIIEFTGSLAGTDQDMLGIEIIAESDPDTTFKLVTKTPAMATLLRKASATSKEIAAVLHLTVWLVNEQDEEEFDEYTFHVPLTLIAPVNMDDLIAAVDVNWATPLSRESYLQHSPTQIATGQRHYLIDTAIGDDVTTEFTITHDLGTRFILVQLQEADATGQFLHLGTDYEVEIVSDNAIKLIFATAPAADTVIGQITSAAHDANFEPHTHTIAEIDGLEARLAGIEAAVAVLQISSAAGSLATRDAAAGAVVSEKTFRPIAEGYPMGVDLAAAIQSASTQTTTTPATTSTGPAAASAAINRIADIPQSVLAGFDAALIGAVHDAAVEAITVPLPAAAGNAGKVYQNRTADRIYLPGDGSRDSSYLLPGDCAASNGTRLYPVVPDGVPAGAFKVTVSTGGDIVAPGIVRFPTTGGTPVMFVAGAGGALPSGISALTQYYTRDVSGYLFKIAATVGGTVIDITTAGTAPFYVFATAGVSSSFYPRDLERQLCIAPVKSTELLIGYMAEMKLGFEAAMLSLATAAGRMDRSLTQGRWKLRIEIGVPIAESTPGAPGGNLRAIDWLSTGPVVEEVIYLTRDTSAIHTFGARIKRTADTTFVVEKMQQGFWSASDAVVNTANFFVQATLSQWDVEDRDEVAGIVVLLGLDKVTSGSSDAAMGKLVIKKISA